MAEVELFGAMKGAYTSADVTNPGKALASYGGTLFLDELGTLSPSAQARLLLFIQDGTFMPMGWIGDPLRVPVQVVAATNDRLAARVARGDFRADLFYRFGRTLTLPPLRDVKHDLPYLVDHLLQQASVNPNRRVSRVSHQALDKLMAHDYPGNVRELETVLARAVGAARQANLDSLTSEDISFDESTLPREDAVVGFVTRQTAKGAELLLIWNANWGKWFVPAGHVRDETFEDRLRRELQERLGLAANYYVDNPIPAVPSLRLIQFSRREQRLKHYYFRLIL